MEAREFTQFNAGRHNSCEDDEFSSTNTHTPHTTPGIRVVLLTDNPSILTSGNFSQNGFIESAEISDKNIYDQKDYSNLQTPV